MKHTILVAVLLLVGISSHSLVAQCTINTFGPPIPPSGVIQLTATTTISYAQTFQACGTGDFVNLNLSGIVSGSPGTFTGNLIVGSGTDPNNTGTVLSVTPFSFSGGPFNIALATPVSVVSGNDYYFIIEPTSIGNSLSLTISGNAYSGGNRFVSNAPNGSPNYVADGNDINFLATINAPPAIVPTLSQWGLILLALVILAIGSIVIWRKSFVKISGRTEINPN